MKNHSYLLTRKAIFDEEGIRYDVEALERDVECKWRASKSGTGNGNGHGRLTSAIIGQSLAERRHEDLDALAGLTSASRTASDEVRPELFDKMKLHIQETCDDFRQKVNKFLAHAATPPDRPAGVYSSVTLAALFDAAKVIKETFGFLSDVVLGRAHPLVPAAELFDVLEYIECPLVRDEDVPKVRRVWDETRRKLSASFADTRGFIKGLGLSA